MRKLEGVRGGRARRRWTDKVKEFMFERGFGSLSREEQNVWIRCWYFCHLWEYSQREQGV